MNGGMPEDHQIFQRSEWAKLRANTPLTLSAGELAALRGVNDAVSLEEVVDIYLPLSRLLNLYIRAASSLAGVKQTFLARPHRPRPYIVAVAGSVAVGKSTFARVLRELLARWPEHARVDLVTTDGFLRPNRTLEAEGLMNRKGFPETYDLRRMVRFLSDVRSGVAEVHAPVYSHVSYDIVPGQTQAVREPDVLVFEGLSLLQTNGSHHTRPATIVSDFFDFSIYIDAEETDIERWYVERFLTLRDTVFRTRGAYFRDLADLSLEQAPQAARQIWRDINRVNLLENILPTRERANLVLRKAEDHTIQEVWLR